MPLSEARKIMDGLSDAGCFYLSVTGGEPLLVEHLFDLLAYARKSRIKYIHLVTNGYLLDAPTAGNLKDVGINEVSVSIDARQEIHDKNRGVAGAYQRAVEAVENLKRYAPKIRIVLNAIFFPDEPAECLHVVALARALGVYVKVQPLNQHPAFNLANYVSLPPKNISAERISETIAKLRRESCVVNSRVFLDNIYNFFCCRDRLIFKNSHCLFGYHHLEILEDGSIFPCLEGLHWQGGRPIQGSLAGLLRSREYKQVVEALRTCRGCQRSCYICYYEPRIVFPINNFLRSLLSG